MKCRTVIFLIVLVSVVLVSFDVEISEFRHHLRNIVSEGNHQYEISNRSGIKIYIDSLETAIKAYKGKIDKNDSLEFTADLLKLKGDFHYENSNIDETSYSKAEKFFRQALDIYDTHSFFNGNLNCAPMIHRELAQLYYKQRQYDKARNEMQIAYDAFSIAYENFAFNPGDDFFLQYLDIKAYLAICDARLGRNSSAEIDEVMEFYKTEYTSLYNADSDAYYYETLRKKAKIIMLLADYDSQSQAVELYKRYFDWVRDESLCKLRAMATTAEREDYWMQIRPFVVDAYQTEKANPSLLYDVTLFAKGLLLQLDKRDNETKSLCYSWEQVSGRLSENACAVEFIQYIKNDRQCLAALVLRCGDTPQFVQMTSPDSVLNFICDGMTCQERITSTNGELKNGLYNDEELRTMIFNDELKMALNQCDTIYFAPDGYLHQLAIEYMKPKELEHSSMFRLTSTRSLIDEQITTTDLQGSALLVGGIRYNDGRAAETSITRGSTGFAYLPGTLKEVDSIRSIRANDCDTLLTGYKATKSAFMNLCPFKSLIFMATHGSFKASALDYGTDLKPCYTDNSLDESFLVMARADDSSGKSTYKSTLLTAREIANLDLSSTEIVVLSACQTGNGYVTADGVYGLQRGFKIAGAKSLIVSLWSVNDRATFIFMTEFYRQLAKTANIVQSIEIARNVLSIAENARYNEPQYLNAFVVLDAMR